MLPRRRRNFYLAFLTTIFIFLVISVLKEDDSVSKFDFGDTSELEVRSDEEILRLMRNPDLGHPDGYLRQTDPDLVRVIREKFLLPPSNVSFWLLFKGIRISALEGYGNPSERRIRTSRHFPILHHGLFL